MRHAVRHEMSPTQLVVKTELGLILQVDRYPVLLEAEEEELDRLGVANERLKELEQREKEFLPDTQPGKVQKAHT